jgi:hypothetical protein
VGYPGARRVTKTFGQSVRENPSPGANETEPLRRLTDRLCWTRPPGTALIASGLLACVAPNVIRLRR